MRSTKLKYSVSFILLMFLASACKDSNDKSQPMDKHSTTESMPAEHVHSTNSKNVNQSKDKVATNQNVITEQSKADPVYTCPMHPQIRQPSEGRCPICGMELVLSQTSGQGSETEQTLTVSAHTRRIAGIKTDVVISAPITKKIQAVGRITYDESKVESIASYNDGRIEKLFADYTGIEVKKGDHLAVVYSPELYNAQVEYLLAKKSINFKKQLLPAAKSKLIELGMSTSQINKLHKTNKANSRVEIYSPATGTVTVKNINSGSYIKKGQVLYQIADLSTVWLVLEVFPEEASLIHYGQKVEATLRSNPGVVQKGRVAFIEPVISLTSRTVKVRVEVENKNRILKPGDYADATLEVALSTATNKGKIYDKDLIGKWISPMHPQIVRNKPGKCPICGMALIKASEYGFTDKKEDLDSVIAVPRDAVLKVGQYSVIFVEESKDTFKLRKVVVGPTVGDQIIIKQGLEEYESIAVDGVFLLDSQMQLSGKTSLISVSTDDNKK